MADRGEGKTSRFKIVAAWAVTGCVVAAAAVCHLGWLWWPLDLSGSFRVQYALAAAGAVIICIVLRRWIPVLLCAAGMVLLWVPILWLYRSQSQNADTSASIVLVHWNTGKAAGQVGSFLKHAAVQRADLVLLQEVTEEMMPMLRASETFQIVYAVPRPDTRGVAALSRHGLDAAVSAAVHYLADEDRPTLDVEVVTEFRTLRVLGFHSKRPNSAANYAIQQREFTAAGEWATQVMDAGAAAILIGDFNATTWSQPLIRLNRETGIRNSQRGFGIHPTFPAQLPWPLRIAIDHCLYSPDLQPLGRTLLPAHESDHLPLRVEIGFQ